MKALSIIAAILVSVVAFVWLSFPTHTFRYRLTLDTSVDGQLRSGSGIFEISLQEKPDWFPANGSVTPSVKGEAVVVDLGSKGLLFALLTGDPLRNSSPAYELASSTFSDPKGLSATLWKIKASIGRVDVPLNNLPLLVRFGDLADPKSVARVDPNDLAASFGPGVKLVRATIEITDDPVTTGIEKRLGWLALPWEQQRLLLKGPYWDSDDPKYSYANRLLPINFKMGV